MDTLGMRIRKVRKMYNLRQKDFADRLFVSAAYISMLEADKEHPTDMLLKLISLDFNISFLWLKEGAGEMSINKKNDYFERKNNDSIKAELTTELQIFNALLKKIDVSSINLNTSGIVQALGRVIDNEQVNTSVAVLIYEQIASIIISDCDFVSDLNNNILPPTSVGELYKQLKKLSDDNYDCLMEIGSIYEKLLFQK